MPNSLSPSLRASGNVAFSEFAGDRSDTRSESSIGRMEAVTGLGRLSTDSTHGSKLCSTVSNKLEVVMSWNKGKASGYTLVKTDAPIIFGMVARDDRDHDIAAWFGVNQGRIAEVKDGSKFGIVGAAHASQLPPSGPPGIKGRRLRAAADKISKALAKGASGLKEAEDLLQRAIASYDANEA